MVAHEFAQGILIYVSSCTFEHGAGFSSLITLEHFTVVFRPIRMLAPGRFILKTQGTRSDAIVKKPHIFI